MASEAVYTTYHEIYYLEGLCRRKPSLFVMAARDILEDRRTYEGPGMNVDTLKLKRWIRQKFAENVSQTSNESSIH